MTSEGEEVSTTLGEVDQFRLSKALPVRKFQAHKKQRHYSGLFWSATTRHHVPYESRLELDRLWLADFDSSVAWIASQPMWLTGIDNGALRRHVPDFLLTHVDDSVTVVDVKPREFALRPKAAEVFAWTQELCTTRGWKYEVWHGGDPTVLANIKFVSAARRKHLHPFETAWISTGSPPETEHPADSDVLYDLWSGQRPTELDVPLSHSQLTP
ncbi:TnsA-like heteromeric transposase endonuclease subunit [Nesterenkonia jeotgali]|uniref:TnsA-like heteromeric transposase endonuclease subunit n=1 Tax=Nesterenkonia jeotgali TaxID=317018 RepID=UPI0018DD1583|nr:TnsA-like heteromeric transposase endonuclease subunit [Nesterenkonia jeotgali]